MIVVTGAAGFIGSVLVGELNRRGREDLVLVDAFGRADRAANLAGKRYARRVERADLGAFLDELRVGEAPVEAVYHMGARTDTAEPDRAVFERLNVAPSKALWRFCTERAVPLVYASSAATYGGGEHGYRDDHGVVERLAPLNPYGESKQAFDRWVLAQAETPPFWAGLKFFNVYGPNEYHKGRMASVIFHAFNQIGSTGRMRLFRSHRGDVADGHQARDFVWVGDLVDIALWLGERRPASGLYNVGTGEARTFLDLTRAVFASVGVPEDIGFVDTPADIRDTYQYFTEADMTKLRDAGYAAPFTRLEDGVARYVRDYLRDARRY